jgi:PAS domain S-box-containing protein
MPTPKPLHPVSLHDAAAFRRTLSRAIILPLILTAALAALFLWQITRLLDATRWVEHTDEVISQSNSALKLLIDLETGVRGYLVTGRRDYLEPYERAAPQVIPALDELGQLVSDNPPQLVRVNEIRTLHEEWMGYAREVVALKGEGGDYQSRVGRGVGKVRMDAMRARFDAIVETEERLRDERSQGTRRATRLAVGTGGAAALLLGLILAFNVRRQLVTVSRSYEGALTGEREQRQWLDTTLKSIGDAVIVTDAEGRVTLINAVAEAVTGWKSDEASGRPLPEVFRIVNEGTRAVVENPVTKVLRAGAVVGLANHTVLIAKDGTETPIDDSGAPIKDEEGKTIGVVLVFRDIRERKRAEAEREQLFEREQAARVEAEEANRLKDEFLATASHELRTPLTAIVGWTRMLRAGGLDAKTAAGALETIERNADAQTRLIEDLLDISRIISGKLLLDTRPVEMAPVIRDAVSAVRPAAQAKNIAVLTSVDARTGVVLGDANRLQQVFWNLLSNAVKFTPKGGRIEVRLGLVDSQVEFSVNDTGEGIEPEFIPYVFDRFRQADGSKTRRHGGLGLGLAIVRSLVEMHGGTVGARSEGHGRGATFSVRLPVLALQGGGISDGARETAGGALGIECPPKLDGVRVLLVDDDRDTLEMLDAVLSKCEAEVVKAASAAEALREIERRRPDVLVSDIGMPEADGYEFIKRVRAFEAERGDASSIPALALTAYAKPEDRVRALTDGYQVHLSKPVEPAEFALVVANLIGRGGTSG